MSTRIEPELLLAIENIVERRLREELAKRDQMVTKSEFAEAMERIDQRLAESQRSFEEYQRETHQRFDAVDRRFDAVDRRFDAVDRRFDALEHKVDQLTIGAGESFERFCISIIRELHPTNEPLELLRGKWFRDPAYRVHSNSQFVEIDIFCTAPPIAAECTYRVTSANKVEKFARKVEFLRDTEFRDRDDAQFYFFSLEVPENLRDTALALRAELGIRFIVKYGDGWQEITQK
jgi:hypothetical protein